MTPGKKTEPLAAISSVAWNRQVVFQYSALSSLESFTIIFNTLIICILYSRSNIFSDLRQVYQQGLAVLFGI